MTLTEYLQVMLPVLAPEKREGTLADYQRAVRKLTGWLCYDVRLADVSPHLVERFREVHPLEAGNIRAIMSTYDPLKFKKRNPKNGSVQRAKRRSVPSAAGAYLFNVYKQRYEPTALRSRALNTKRLYLTTLNTFDRFLGRSATLDDLTDDTVARFASWRLSNGLSKFSVNKDLFNLLALWRWCCRKGLVEGWPDVELERPPRRQPVAWTKGEIRRLYRTIERLPGKVGAWPACNWWAALLLLLWDSGERIGGVLKLQWEQVDLDRGWVRFVAEHRKGGREDSTVRLSDDARAALRKIQADSGPVLPWPLSYGYLWNRFGQVLKLAGLPTDSKSKFHRIRKTVASFAEAAGANATAMLRHSKREITQCYLDPRIVKQQQPSDVLFRLTDAAVVPGCCADAGA